MEEELEGAALAYKLFSKLIEDASLYPKLTATLMTNAILSQEEENPIKKIEQIITEGFQREYGEDEAAHLSILISGAYYGLINHYHINNKTFDGEEIKKEFKKLLSHIVSK